jgi:hypothetical protein
VSFSLPLVTSTRIARDAVEILTQFQEKKLLNLTDLLCRILIRSVLLNPCCSSYVVVIVRLLCSGL